MPRSRWERMFEVQLQVAGIEPPRIEHRFHPVRRWRFDFAWPGVMLALEIEGGTWSAGRHVRGRGFEEDCEKHNEAALCGWRVLRATGRMVEEGTALDLVERALSGTNQRQEEREE